MKIVKITHDGNLPYLFETPVDLAAGASVVVDTAHGKSYGFAMEASVELDDALAEYIFPCWSGKHLRKVVGLVREFAEVAEGA